MEDKEPTLTHEVEKKEQPPEYAELESTLQELIIGNPDLSPSPEHDDQGNITAIRYRINTRAGAGSVIGFGYRLRIPEDPSEKTHIAVYDGFEPEPAWEWDAGATEIETVNSSPLGQLTPKQAARMNQIIRTSDYFREHKGTLPEPKTSNAFTRWLRRNR